MHTMTRPSMILLAGVALAAVALPLSAAAQEAVARPVVQPLPDPAAARLAEVLRALAREPRSMPLLLEAGEVSLRLEDTEAARGFFTRAQAVDPGDPRLKAGQAALALRQDRTVEALQLFAEAERAGVPVTAFAADRGLAYDLVGDNARAQREYARVLAQGPDTATTMRLALSQAIAGDARASEATLLPLLQRSDLAAFRTRAFALAIAGREEEAVSIAQTMLPERISSRLSPYLRFMPRLTKAQQAAAANLGRFPRSDAIGRDDPAIAAWLASNPVLAAAPAAPVQTADARLVPTGAPLGPAQAAAATPTRTETRSERRRNSEPRVASRTTTTVRQAPEASAARAPAAAPTPTPAPVRSAAAAVAAAPVSSGNTSPVAAPPPAAALPAPTPPRVAAVAPPPVAAAPVQGPPALAPAPAPAPVPALAAAPPPTPAAVPVQVAQAALAAAAAPVAAPATAPAPPPPRDLAQAFADFARPIVVAVPEGAVDLTQIRIRREPPPAPKAPPEPPKPVHPSRQWVQVATGRDTGALGFDWRRLKREAGGLLDKYKPQTARWGQTNRLVVGPFASAREADQFVGRLKDKKIDSFRFGSAEGEEVKALP